MADLGDDFHCLDDVDFGLTEVTGRRCLAEAVARRWFTRRGTLFYDPAYGLGLEDWLHGERHKAMSTLAPALENEALRDERVLAAEVAVHFEGETLFIRAELTDADGPFRLVANVADMTVALLEEETG